MVEPCPLCGSEKQRFRRPLYGYRVCNKCIHRFASRRQFAWLLDMALIYFAVAWLAVFLGGPVPSWLVGVGGVGHDTPPSPLDPLLLGLTLLLCLTKDGLAGRSPGKLLFGLKVVDDATGRPIGFIQSIKRNWPALLPIMPLIMAGQSINGKRAGDGLARTRVVWNRHASNLVFAAVSLPEQNTSDGPGSTSIGSS